MLPEGYLISSEDGTVFDGCWGVAGDLLYYRMLGVKIRRNTTVTELQTPGINVVDR